MGSGYVKPADSMDLRNERQPNRIGLGGFVVLWMLALLLGTGCYRWVPIEPNFANGQPRILSEVRVGGDGGDVLIESSVKWPILTSGRGRPLTVDLRRTPAERRAISPGGTAALIIGLSLGVSLTVALIVVAEAFGRGGYCGGC